jgi:hypothetical protein
MFSAIKGDTSLSSHFVAANRTDVFSLHLHCLMLALLNSSTKAEADATTITSSTNHPLKTQAFLCCHNFQGIAE